MARYFQRSETITLSAGDAMRTNAATHIINPWPPGVRDRKIAFNGNRMVSGINRYQGLKRPTDQLPDIGISGEAMGQKPPTAYDYNVTGTGTSAVSVPLR